MILHRKRGKERERNTQEETNSGCRSRSVLISLASRRTINFFSNSLEKSITHTASHIQLPISSLGLLGCMTERGRRGKVMSGVG